MVESQGPVKHFVEFLKVDIFLIDSAFEHPQHIYFV